MDRLWDCCSRGWRWLDRWSHVYTSGLACAFAALALVFGVVAAVQRVELHDHHFWVNWGSVPEWGQALATLVAFGALAIAVGEWRDGRIRHRKEETHRQHLERREQAELITGWVRNHVVSGVVPDIKCYVQVGLINASRGVVHDVFVRLMCSSADPISVGTALPAHREARGHLHVLPPDICSLSVTLPSRDVMVGGLEIYFRDSSGVRWRRDVKGRLEEWPEPPFPVLRENFWRSSALKGFGTTIEIQTLWAVPLPHPSSHEVVGVD